MTPRTVARAHRRAGRPRSSARSTAPRARRAASRWSAIRIRSSAARWTTRSCRRWRAPSCSSAGAACASTSAASARREGTWDEGRGEVDDALAVIATCASGAIRRRRFLLGRLLVRRLRRGRGGAPPAGDAEAAPDGARRPVDREAADARRSPPDTIVIHGETDDVVPLAATLDWARPQAAAGRSSSPASATSSTASSRLLKNVIVRATARPRRGLTAPRSAHASPILTRPMLPDSRSTTARLCCRSVLLAVRRRRRRAGAAAARGRRQELHRARPDEQPDARRARRRRARPTRRR